MAEIIEGLGRKVLDYVRGEAPTVQGMFLITLEKDEHGMPQVRFTPQGRIDLMFCDVAIKSIVNFIQTEKRAQK